MVSMDEIIERFEKSYFEKHHRLSPFIRKRLMENTLTSDQVERVISFWESHYGPLDQSILPRRIQLITEDSPYIVDESREIPDSNIMKYVVVGGVILSTLALLYLASMDKNLKKSDERISNYGNNQEQTEVYKAKEKIKKIPKGVIIPGITPENVLKNPEEGEGPGTVYQNPGQDDSNNNGNVGISVEEYIPKKGDGKDKPLEEKLHDALKKASKVNITPEMRKAMDKTIADEREGYLKEILDGKYKCLKTDSLEDSLCDKTMPYRLTQRLSKDEYKNDCRVQSKLLNWLAVINGSDNNPESRFYDKGTGKSTYNHDHQRKIFEDDSDNVWVDKACTEDHTVVDESNAKSLGVPYKNQDKLSDMLANGKDNSVKHLVNGIVVPVSIVPYLNPAYVEDCDVGVQGTAKEAPAIFHTYEPPLKKKMHDKVLPAEKIVTEILPGKVKTKSGPCGPTYMEDEFQRTDGAMNMPYFDFTPKVQQDNVQK